MTLLALLLAPAARAELPWECPAIASPEDAHVFRNTDGGLQATWRGLDEEARAWIEDDCAWSEVALGDGSVESTCLTSIGATVVTVEGEYSYVEDGVFYYSGSIGSIAVELPAGAATWTSLAVELTQDGSVAGGAGSVTDRYSAVWTGAVPGAPDDGGFESLYSRVCSSAGCDTRRAVTTPTCAWSWSFPEGGGYETVETGGHVAAVTWYWYGCTDYRQIGYFDDVKVGRVDLITWARDYSDADGDGWPAGPDDCDDGDPERYACGAIDTTGDGVDQDCDGVDGRAEPDGDDTADTGGDTGPTDTAPADTGAADTGVDEAPSGGPEAERPIASTTREETNGCFGGAAAAVFALGPVAAARRRRRG